MIFNSNGFSVEIGRTVQQLIPMYFCFQAFDFESFPENCKFFSTKPSPFILHQVLLNCPHIVTLVSLAKAHVEDN